MEKLNLPLRLILWLATSWFAGSTLVVPSASGQSVCLPAPRLLTVFPCGARVGTEVEVTITGQYLEEPGELRFSHPGISASQKLDINGQPEPHRYLLKIADNCPVGVYEARVMTRLGISSARAFSVDQFPESTAAAPNTSLATAMELSVNSICNAVATGKSVDHYTFAARADQRIIVDCAARGIDSKLNPVLIVADGDGKDLVAERLGGAIDFSVPHDGRYIIKLHDLTFNGGPEFFYRLAVKQIDTAAVIDRLPVTASVNSFSWPPTGLSAQAPTVEAEPNHEHSAAQRIELPCDLSGSFFPAADVDTFEFTAQAGDTWWVEVGSERLGLQTDPLVVVQRVTTDDQGNEVLIDLAELNDIPSPVKVSSNGYSYDGPPFNAGSCDVLGQLKIEQTGVYRLQLLDQFGGTRNEPHNIYRLVIRKPAPDFAIVAWAMHMNLRNGDRNALSKPIALRQGATMPLEVVVIRRDGFDGEIELVMDNLPDGVSASGLKIPAGMQRGIMLITADQGAPRGVSDASFVGRAQIDGETVTRPCRLASLAWPVPDAWSEIPAPRLLADLPVSVSPSEIAPITFAAQEQKVWEVKAGEQLTLPLIHTRHCDFSGESMTVKAFGAGFENLAPFAIPLTADRSETVIDLAQTKTPPGDYTIAFYGSAVAKHRHNPRAVSAAQAALEVAKAEAAASRGPASDATDPPAQVAGESSTAPASAGPAASGQQRAAALVDAAAKRLQAATEAAKPTDIVDIIVSKPISIRVQAAETK